MDEKTKELIAIGTSVGAHCQPCLNYHIDKAGQMGIEEDEMREAIRIGHMVEKGAMNAMREFSSSILEENSTAPAGGSCCGPTSGGKGSKCC